MIKLNINRMQSQPSLILSLILTNMPEDQPSWNGWHFISAKDRRSRLIMLFCIRLVIILYLIKLIRFLAIS